MPPENRYCMKPLMNFFRSFGFKSDADLPIFELNDIHETVEINQNSEQEKADTELEKQEKA